MTHRTAPPSASVPKGPRGSFSGRLARGALFLILFGALFPAAFAAERGAILSLKEIREQGVVMQRYETSCAAASVATVLTYGFRDAVSEKYVAVLMLEQTDTTKVRSRGGFSLLDMKRFVEARGYRGQAYRNLSLDDLVLFHAPIVPIDPLGYNHYVVFNGIQGDQVLLADPAFGNRKMKLDRFQDMWLDGLAFVIIRNSESMQ